jgi:hypothetical protein
LTQQIYDTLWHYSEQFTRDPLERSELLTMAWREGEKLGEKSSVKLMQSLMHFRSKELKIRSAFPADEVGKSQRDIWNRAHESTDTTTIASTKFADPFHLCIVSDFNNALTPDEQILADAIIAGYNSQEIQKMMGIGYLRFKELKLKVQEKAVKYLV